MSSDAPTDRDRTAERQADDDSAGTAPARPDRDTTTDGGAAATAQPEELTTGGVRTARSITAPDPDADTLLELESVHKRYGSEQVIDDLSLSVREGEILTLLGPSGCGKTTTLRLIAGLERPDAGRIRLNGRTVADDATHVPPEKRDVGVVFQEFALFPHMTAAENIAFGLQDRSAEKRRVRVEEMLDLVGLASHRDDYPDELSGGQQQRVALARSLAPEPAMLLLDEPFSNLDVDLRVAMREEVRKIIKEAGVTAVSVTHDQEEAMSISDRVAVINDGAIEQIGTPEAVFQHPESRFVAGFLGHASFLSGTVDGDVVHTGVGDVDRELIHGLVPEYDGTAVDVLVRPDDLAAEPVVERIDDPDLDPSKHETANGQVVYRRYLGPTILYRVELGNGDVLECMHNHTDRLELGTLVQVRLSADHELAWFPAEQNPDG